MPGGLLFSILFHAAVLLVTLISLPSLRDRAAAPSGAPMQVVQMAEIMRAPPSSPAEKPAPPKPEPPKVEQPKPEPPKAEAPPPPPPPPPPKPPEPAKVEAPPPPKPEPRPEPPKPVEATPAPKPAPEPDQVAALPPKPDPKPEVKPEPKPEPPKKEPEPARKEPQPAAKKEPERKPDPPKPVEKVEKKEPPKPKQDELASIEKVLKDLRKPEPAPPKKAEEPKPKKPDFADIEKMLNETRKSEPPKPEPRRTTDLASIASAISAPSQRMTDARLSMGEEDALRRQIEKCWNVPAGLRDAEELIVEVRVWLDPEGRVQRAEGIRSSALAGRPGYQQALDSAVRAVHVCQSRFGRLDVPPGKYSTWKEMRLTFNPKDLLG